MIKSVFLILFATAHSFFLTVNAQTQFTGWVASFNTIKTGKQTSLHTDIQLRSTNGWEQIQTILIRPGINFHLTKKMVITAGYAFISNRRTVNNISGMVPEHRIWEQLLYNHKWKNIFISHRLRLEQRFISKVTAINNTLEANGTAYANRFRYFNRTILPFKKEKIFSKGMFTALQNEVFINIGNTANVNGEFFDQNRLYLATGYRINTKTDLEIGYMNQYVNGRGRQFTNNHILQLAGYLRL
ncbi:MAG TPA: DUF2490 domain-containing protein [Chitinophagaceae bacterium]|nr:DUF2490 domain-containing protein [Chitinophagaceae bacterium]HNU13054.1 DUF2490 domain-containing protein [Chitinophagaceae bacterium]